MEEEKEKNYTLDTYGLRKTVELDYDKMNLDDIKNLLKQIYKEIDPRQAEKFNIPVKKK